MNSQAAALKPVAAVSERDMANAIRALAMDSVQKANSGHPGMPMGMADVATVLFNRFIKIDPSAPDWPDRDRFVLSAGHGSMLQYALHYLLGYADMPIEAIAAVPPAGQPHRRPSRIWPCAWHRDDDRPAWPRHRDRRRHGAGRAHACCPLRRRSRRSLHLCDRRRRLPAGRHQPRGDRSCRSSEARPADRLLGRQCDLDRRTDLALDIDGPAGAVRGRRLGCPVGRRPRHGSRRCGNRSRAAVGPAVADRLPHDDRQGRAQSAAARKRPMARRWAMPRSPRRARTSAGPQRRSRCRTTSVSPGAKLPSAGKRRGAPGSSGLPPRRSARPSSSAVAGELPDAVFEALGAFRKEHVEKATKVATRKASEMALGVINAATELTIGGSADLTHSNLTITKGMDRIAPGDYAGRYIHYGIREHGMAAAMNGIALHGGFVPYGGTFLCFADYARGAMRLSALMGQRVIYVMTHDSIGLGEDGPTHQPIEHLAMLRATPNLNVFRPADIIETAECWELALKSKNRPSVLVLSRQNLPMLRHAHGDENRSSRGAYVLREPSRAPRRDADRHRLGGRDRRCRRRTGCEAEHGIAAAVVSMPCWELFEEQDAGYPQRFSARRRASPSRPRHGSAGIAGSARRRLRRHGRLRRQRPCPGSLPAFRHHARSRRRSGAEAHHLRKDPNHGPHHPSPTSRPCRRARLRRAGIQHQQHGTGPRHHGGGQGLRRAGHHPGLARRPLLCQRHHAGQDDGRVDGNAIRPSRSASTRTTATTKPPA